MFLPNTASSSQPFAGLRILDLSAVVSGPMATGILADQGADVIKVESKEGDLTRIIGPAKGDISALFASINRGKRAIVLDLKHEDGKAALRSLIEWADVLVENFRPGALARLGFSYEAAASLNARLIYLSISGFGQTGPYANFRVYDPVIQAVSGMADAHANLATGEPQLLQTLMCDKLTSITAAQALGAALFARSQTGRGQKIELSMLDAALSFLWPEALFNHSFLDGVVAPAPEYGANQKLWKAADGWFAMVTPQSDEFAAMCRVLGVQALISDPRFATLALRREHQAIWRAQIEAVVITQRVDDLVAKLGAAGVPVGRVNRKAEIANDPQVLASQSLQETHQAGIGRLRMARAAAIFNPAREKSGVSDEASVQALQTRHAPHIGQHTNEVLAHIDKQPQRRIIDFYFDFVSPYGYFAIHQIEALAKRHGCQLRWHPFHMRAVSKDVLGVQTAMVDIPLKGDYVRRDVVRMAQYLDLPYAPAPAAGFSSVLASRLFYVLLEIDQALAIRYAKAVFESQHAKAASPNTWQACQQLAIAAGALQGGLIETAVVARGGELLRQATDDAVAKGVWGTPTFALDGELFWGNDRLALLEDELIRKRVNTT